MNTPELDALVVLVSSPLALLVALWGMTSSRLLRLISAFGINKHELDITDTQFSLAPTKMQAISA